MVSTIERVVNLPDGVHYSETRVDGEDGVVRAGGGGSAHAVVTVSQNLDSQLVEFLDKKTPCLIHTQLQ